MFLGTLLQPKNAKKWAASGFKPERWEQNQKFPGLNEVDRPILGRLPPKPSSVKSS
jgi:hypothetical protein